VPGFGKLGTSAICPYGFCAAAISARSLRPCDGNCAEREVADEPFDTRPRLVRPLSQSSSSRQERYLVGIEPDYLFGQCSPYLFGQCSPLRPQPASSRPIDFFWHKGVAASVATLDARPSGVHFSG